jgi:hypothetical protein
LQVFENLLTHYARTSSNKNCHDCLSSERPEAAR